MARKTKSIALSEPLLETAEVLSFEKPTKRRKKALLNRIYIKTRFKEDMEQTQQTLDILHAIATKTFAMTTEDGTDYMQEQASIQLGVDPKDISVEWIQPHSQFKVSIGKDQYELSFQMNF